MEDSVWGGDEEGGEMFHLIQAFGLAIVSTFYNKRHEGILIYTLGGKSTMIYSCMARREDVRIEKMQSDTRGDSCNTA